jgi:hypothetical protein
VKNGEKAYRTGLGPRVSVESVSSRPSPPRRGHARSVMTPDHARNGAHPNYLDGALLSWPCVQLLTSRCCLLNAVELRVKLKVS